ncbi:MAG TPA: Crp/Fnr family transcriptional regulator [Azospirillaceae bacterium]|nr:Crp/Fnr family transcriptional regulator [Azospirillaceae bacterium]
MHPSLPSSPTDSVQNRLLLALPPDDRAQLLALLEPVRLAHKQVLHDAGEPIGHVYFIEEGVVSLVVPLEGGQEIEVGLLDREGMVGLPVVLGQAVAPTQALVQVPGRALRLPAARLRAEIARGGPLLALLLRAVAELHAQVVQTAACNARHNLVERLARWLLMLHDRISGDDIPITHEMIATLLGVRRSGITVAVSTLEKADAISHDRGIIKVLDRPRLEEASCECYGAVRRDPARPQA